METETYTNSSHLGRKIEKNTPSSWYDSNGFGGVARGDKTGYFQNGTSGKDR